MIRPLLLLLVLASLSLWLTRHAWLTNPSAYKVSSQLSEVVGLTPPSAQRPELLTIASHARLQSHRSRHYQIHGQIYNPTATPLAAPSIVFTQLDRDNQILDTIRYPANDWQNTSQAIPAHGFADFILQLPSWPDNSWGYQIQLSD